MKLGTLVASGKPVEVTRYAGTVGQGIMLQLTADTGYVQVQLAELLRVLLNPHPPIEEKTVEERDGPATAELSSLLDADDQAVAALYRHLAARTKELDRLRIENARLREARTEDVPDPWKLLETLHRELMASMPSEISIEIGELA